MIKANFKRYGGKIIGFSVSGHSGYSDPGSDIVCASVSSAVMLTCNLATEIFKLPAEVNAGENDISLNIPDGDQGIIEALFQHLKAIEEEYPKNIKVKVSEV